MSANVRFRALAAGLLTIGLVAGCASGPVRPRPSASAVAVCRGRTEQTFNRQNRDLLAARDDRDTPFSNSYNSGITSAGLSRQFEHDQLMSSCLSGGQSSSDDVGTSFSPRASDLPGLPGP